ncbi:hypothetical protein HYW42_02515 [Candidatus Daviesbacteria bacterium]|nr:hypothetical protein [Candidatus Daviesbacteria bacterium]
MDNNSNSSNTDNLNTPPTPVAGNQPPQDPELSFAQNQNLPQNPTPPATPFDQQTSSFTSSPQDLTPAPNPPMAPSVTAPQPLGNPLSSDAIPPTDPNSFLNPQSNPYPTQPVTPTESLPPSFNIPEPLPAQPVPADPITNPAPQEGIIPTTDTTISPSWEGIPSTQNTYNPQPPQASIEQAPTDLSHLITDTTDFTNTSLPANTQAETLTTQNANTVPETSTTTPPNPSKGVPKWILGLGAGLLLAVSAASAYFILGVGQPKEGTTSLPATTENTAQQIKPPPPASTPAPQSEEMATGSANFGQMEDSTQSPAPAATSAAELLRQRQQGQ